MRKVHLYGALGQQFGETHEFEVATVSETIQALRANFEQFTNALRHGFYRVVVGKTEANGLELDELEAASFKLGSQELHIVPVIEGSKRGGLGKIIAGIALIGLSAVTGGAAGAMMLQPLWGAATVGSVIGSIGTGLLLTGVASLIAPQQKSEDDAKSHTSSGPAVSTREGGIVPIAYGEVITGGTMINGILTVRQGDGTEKPKPIVQPPVIIKESDH